VCTNYVYNVLSLIFSIEASTCIKSLVETLSGAW
jgi:hypothetical protein